jgi:hypothetical protein
MWGALSDEKTGLSFTIAAGPRQPVAVGSEYRGTHGHILISQIRDSPKLEGQYPAFIFPRNRVAPGTELSFRRLLSLIELR